MTNDIVVYLCFLVHEAAEWCFYAGETLGTLGPGPDDEENFYFVAGMFRRAKANALLAEFTRVIESIPPTGPLAATEQRDPIEPLKQPPHCDTLGEYLRLIVVTNKEEKP